MRILKLSSTKNTRMNKNWIASSSIGNFWMSWRFKFLLSILKKAKIIINNKKKIMDLGCGNGVLSNQIENYRNVKIDRVDSDINSLRDNQKVKGKLTYIFIISFFMCASDYFFCLACVSLFVKII